MQRFVTFGCWNYGGCSRNSGLQQVIQSISHIPQVSFMVVNGDNYYQPKDEFSNKHVDAEELMRGFDCLRSLQLETYLLLGNHDLEMTSQEDAQQTCETLLLEMDIAQQENATHPHEYIHLPTDMVMFREVGATLIIMIDTNLYAGEHPQCFVHLLQQDLDTPALIAHQHTRIMQYLQHNDGTRITSTKKSSKKSSRGGTIGKMFSNIVVCGHHPLIGFKNQVVKTDKKGKTKVKGGIELYSAAMYELMLDISEHVHAPHLYYLCADIHNYQKGIVTITDSSAGRTATVRQWIAGTGGAKLDDDYDEKYAMDFSNAASATTPLTPLTPLTPVKTVRDIPIHSSLSISYQINEHWSDYGYLIVDILRQGRTIHIQPMKAHENHVSSRKDVRKRTQKSKKTSANKTRQRSRSSLYKTR